MRIAYIYTALTTVGGADRVITEKANYFAEHFGYDVYIITDSQGKEKPKFTLSPKVHLVNLDIMFGQQYNHSFFVRGFYYFKLMKEYKRKLSDTLNQIKPDFTISVLGRDSDFINDLSDGSLKIGEAHVSRDFIRNFHLMEKRSLPYRIVCKIWRKRLDKIVKRLNAFVVLTNDDANNWSHIRNSIVIPNSIPFLDERSSNCSSKSIISVGRLNEQKGFDMLIEAWYLVTRKHPDWSLHIYGDGELKFDLQKQIEKKGINQSVILEYPIKDIQSKYLESDFYVMSSRFEGFGMVLIEAMACGLPCISFNCPNGPADIIDNQKNGFLVENGNIKELAKKICVLIENEESRKNMGKYAKESIKKYSPDIVMQKWAELFESLKNKQK